MFVGTSKERFFYHNTLICLVRGLTGQNITVDLRNDAYVCGKMDIVDGYMNLSFTNVVYCDPQGNEFFFENMFIQGRNIRYVHIPETTSIVSTINKELSSSKKPVANKKGVNESRKVKKALKQHLETVASLQ
ncbi:unnamed protein product [Arctia plantaginis]|uniref:Sm domain-containing protein n=2 Tax=Arctia plantaginis TaxID=874455 RepID=A0A8S0ZVI4_ARCPL|nr:unnamed protein product [Arctia plantaginis]